jgi:hypothetical protein
MPSFVADYVGSNGKRMAVRRIEADSLEDAANLARVPGWVLRSLRVDYGLGIDEPLTRTIPGRLAFYVGAGVLPLILLLAVVRSAFFPTPALVAILAVGLAFGVYNAMRVRRALRAALPPGPPTQSPTRPKTHPRQPWWSPLFSALIILGMGAMLVGLAFRLLNATPDQLKFFLSVFGFAIPLSAFAIYGYRNMKLDLDTEPRGSGSSVMPAPSGI